MVDAVLLFVIHLVAVWVAWFVVIVTAISLNALRELYVDRLEFPPLGEIADASLWWSSVIFVGYAITQSALSIFDWTFRT